MPNILFIIVVLANVFFISRYIQNHDLGMFFNVTGIVFLVLGIVIFIFFLSIDPGYGWTQSIDLTKNYIMIFTSLSVSIAGIVLIVTGQHLHEIHVKSISDSTRCQQLLNDNPEKILRKNWYTLQDQDKKDSLNIYLFQKKSNRNDYKIIATINKAGTTQNIHNLIISSVALPEPIISTTKDWVCPGVVEKDISINFDQLKKLGEQVQFSILLTISGNLADEQSRTISKQTLSFSLENFPDKYNHEQQTDTQIETQVVLKQMVNSSQSAFYDKRNQEPVW